MPDDPHASPAQTVAPHDAGTSVPADHGQLLAWLVRHPPAARAAVRGKGQRPVRLVLDTNVSLDLVVFHDGRWAVLLDLLARGACEALMDEACRDEFARVLGYPQFELAPDRRVRVLQAFDALHRMPDSRECREGPLDGLPQCCDADDQKFIELAFRARADVLLSKDKALLKLARRNRRAGLFEILSPQSWLQRQVACAPES